MIMNDATQIDILAARHVTLDLVSHVLERKRALDEALDSHRGLAALEDRDRGFARLLCLTVLRRLNQLDEVIGRCLARPLPVKAQKVQSVLRLGAAQLLFLGTPAHAAVDTTVELAKALDLSAHVKLINAIMRRLTREGADWVAAQDEAALALPPWLWARWQASYGEATARQMVLAMLEEPPLDLSVAGDPAIWVDVLEAVSLPTGGLRRAGGINVADLPGFESGEWWVQDAAASLAVPLLGEVRGLRIADLCAAPGGKTLQLAARGARVTALDRSAKRLERLRDNLARCHAEAEVLVADAVRWSPAELFDGILLDAPCTSTGTLRRHPDAAWLKRPEDIANLSRTQDGLLRASLSLVKPGGLIVYCVCSVEPEEGPRRIEDLLASGLPVERVPVQADEIGGRAECLTPEGDVRTLPHHLAELGGMDGFYAARLRKQSS